MSKIPWTDKTWNPVAGCTKVSAGCDNCYAERMAVRLAHMGQEKYATTINMIDGKWQWGGRPFCDEKALEIPLHWRKPRRVFVNSMCDTFHEKVPFEFIDKMFAVMALCPQHTFQVLTKRLEQMLRYLTDPLRRAMWHSAVCRTVEAFEKRMPALEQTVKGILPNVHHPQSELPFIFPH